MKSVKNARIITRLLQCIYISRVSRLGLAASGSHNFLEPRQMLMHEKKTKNMHDRYIAMT